MHQTEGGEDADDEEAGGERVASHQTSLLRRRKLHCEPQPHRQLKKCRYERRSGSPGRGAAAVGNFAPRVPYQ